MKQPHPQDTHDMAPTQDTHEGPNPRAQSQDTHEVELGGFYTIPQ